MNFGWPFRIRLFLLLQCNVHDPVKELLYILPAKIRDNLAKRMINCKDSFTPCTLQKPTMLERCSTVSTVGMQCDTFTIGWLWMILMHGFSEGRSLKGRTFWNESGLTERTERDNQKEKDAQFDAWI